MTKPEAAPFDAVIDAPFGRIGIRTRTHALQAVLGEIVYLPNSVDGANSADAIEPRTPLAAEAAGQIRRYLDDPNARFDLPLAAAGTPFQQRVWAGICAIPAGETWTYGQLAARIGSVPRAVGQACGSNPLPIVVPCHRVVGAAGIGGFAHHAGDGFFRDVKRWLLTHEGVKILR